MINQGRFLLMGKGFLVVLPFFGFVLSLVGGDCCFVMKARFGQIEMKGVFGGMDGLVRGV